MVTDFIFDGKRLSDFDCTVVLFNDSKTGEIETDSKFSFNHISLMRGKRQPFIASVYEDPLKMELYIAKNACILEGDLKTSNLIISPTDMAQIKRWLVRPTPHKLSVVGNGYDSVYWMGSFTLEEYVFGDGRIGAHLTFECDAPYGYKNTVEFSGSLSSHESFTFNCTSDEIGWIYPTLKITLGAEGDLELKNSSDDRITKVKNCYADEVLTFTPNQQIFSSFAAHKVTNDFNFVFYRVNNAIDSVINTIQSNLPISYELEYSPVAKVVVV